MSDVTDSPLLQKARAFEYANEALFITDAANSIIAVNRAFTRMTGYAPHDVIGQNPRVLASGQTSPDVYYDMWLALEKNDFWQGEVWDRRRDGSTYPKHLTISVVRNAAHEVENYVASFSDITERKQAADRMFHLAHHDGLTGLLNRTALEVQLQNALVYAQREKHQVGVLLIDLDNFKQVNDTLGHHVGDHLLLQVGRRLKDCVRANDPVARLGGDEFIVVLQDIESAMSVGAIASKIQRSLADAYQVDEYTLYATPSIGVSLYPIDGSDPDVLIKNADSAMYHAKAQGRNNFKFFAASMNAAAHERLKLENALRSALEGINSNQDSQFELYFQPQIHISSGKITGLEALARWSHPELGPIPPTRFIQIAEETGLIQPLGDWVFWEACRRLKEFKEAGVTNMRVAVNLSTQQLRHDNLPVVVRGALACYDLLPEELELEITESTAMQNPAATIAILEQLKDMGIVLAVDDFGTGYSSLSYLKHLPIHRLKLDRTFVKDIDTSREDAAICSATIVLAHSLGLDLVAEGVETTAQRDYLQNLGCDLFQGFLYSKPLPADQLLPFIREWNARIEGMQA
ncbi:EAL domain-containing protein [Dechloromonas sp. TW-R-39-2]|uniref:putative bifunctional diguanylate cyclase/phosphodiesterase n=1 Tax=Dechloromonas sp. TW-R-39-2 TaxID=2654218 RepID=UPI00193E4D3B|nr:EAL domain-containing protein [Dechloromonas sp. TW-R-39-2]QRM19407.1 EAL domain-containing protein [Dechloromonas sp. TW-R-39-2]